MITDLKGLFVTVPTDKVADFLKAYYQPAEGSTRSSDYDKKIAFLGTTGQIFTDGKLYGSSNDDITELKAIVAGLGTSQEDSKKTVIAAINAAKAALVGTSTTQSSGTTETLTSLDDRLDAIETSLNVAGTDQDVIDKIDEVLTWFSGIKETDAQGAAIITAATVVGTKGSGDTASTGLIKDVEDLQAVGATKVEASETNGNIKINGTETKVYTEVANTVHDADYKHITVTSSSVSDGTTTFNKYEHPTTTEHTAAFVKVGNDTNGHVVIGDAIAKSDITSLLDADNGTYDAKGAADAVKGTAATGDNNTLTVAAVSSRVLAIENSTLWETFDANA